MTMNRFISFLMALMMMMCLLPATAEELGGVPEDDKQASIGEGSGAQETALYYTGGVVRRLLPRDDSSDLIDLAYTLTDTPYILLGKEYEWDVYLSGGKAPYEVSVLLAYQTMDMLPFEDQWYVEASFDLPEDASFSYAFSKEGRYFWEFEVVDSIGQTLTFQTRIYESYTAEDETDVTTTVGKANAIVASLVTDDMSDYTRALVLHDWLIYNANYDYTFTYYDASGVLLHGTGVCDSYARAYLMLCTAAGLECMYVSGTAGDDPDPANWENHGWNLVRLGGSWYHVDCTWDDPGTGGSENHNYFCVSDAVMAKDHRWNQPDDPIDNGGMIVPDAEGGEFESTIDDDPVDYDFTFTTWEEFFAAFDAMVARGEHREQTVGLYTGDLDSSEMYSTMGSYSGTKSQELANERLITAASRGHYGNLFYYNLTWNEPTAYIRIDETDALLSVGESVDLVPSAVVPVEDTFVWTSSDTAVATVSYTFDAAAEDPMVAKITAVAPGTAVITVTSADGAQDTFSVTVMKPHQPDLALTLDAADGVTLTWNSIPGVTQYSVMRVFEGNTTKLLTTTSCKVALTAFELPGNVEQSVYVLAERIIGTETVVSYRSDNVPYGAYSFTYSAVIPADATTIGAEAFLNNASLTSVDVSEGVKSIGARAFSGCSGLYVVRIPQSVTSIGTGAFDGCGLRYAEVVEGSYADTWLQTNYPGVRLFY